MTADISSFTMPCGAAQTCRHPICEHCGNMIRTGSMQAKDHPGTRVGTINDQQCRQCVRRGGPPPKKKLVPEQCVNCDVTLRPYHKTAQQVPGTLKHKGRGYCTTCYDKAYRLEKEAKLRKDRAYAAEVRRLGQQRYLEKQQQAANKKAIQKAFDYSDIAHLKTADASVYTITVQRRIRIAKRIARRQNDLTTLQALQHQKP